jgi:PAS domain S-box-containing protein
MMFSVDCGTKNKLIADCILEWCWEYDILSGQTTSSEGYRKCLGYSDEEVIEHINYWRGLIHSEDVDKFDSAFNRIFQGETDYIKLEYRIRGKDNRYRNIFSKGKVYRDNTGSAIYMAGFYNDITVYKTLEESERKCHTIFNNINDMIFLSDVDDYSKPGRIIEVNDVATKMLGYTREEFQQMTSNDFNTYKTLPEHVRKAKEEVLSNLRNNSKNKFSTVQIDLLKKDKSILPVEISSHFFKIDDRLVKLSVARDISERLKSEGELKESIDRNNKIIELSPDAIFIHDNGVVTFANEATAKLVGASSKEEIVGRALSDFLAPAYKKLARFRQHLLQRGIEVESAEMDIKRVDGSLFRGIVASTPMPTKDGFLGISYVKDISEQKWIMEENKRLLEQIIEYDRLKTEFFSNISHELRTPLNIILSSIQLLNMFFSLYLDEPHKFADAFEKYMSVMKQNSYRLLKLINNLIDLTKIDSGYLKINFSNNNIVEVVENIVLSVAPYIESKGIQLTFDTEIEELVIACDEDKIERIVLNLLSNSIKFTKSGGTIEVYMWQENENIKISVKDTGCGIPKDKLNTVFERFRQVDNILTRRAEGSGIGLALVKALVEAHDGSIRLKSEVDKGSEFIIKLPIKLINGFEEVEKHCNEDALNQNKVERISIEFSDIYS